MAKADDVARVTALVGLVTDEPDDVAAARASRAALDVERVSRSVRVSFLVPVGRSSAHVVVTLLAADFDELLDQGEVYGPRIVDELRDRCLAFGGAQLDARRGKVEA